MIVDCYTNLSKINLIGLKQIINLKKLFLLLKKRKNKIEKNNKNEKSKERGNQTIIPKALHFYEWATYLKTNQTFVKTSNIENKFELINSFLAKQQKIIPDKSKLIMKT
jgi:hypothetical protein